MPTPQAILVSTIKAGARMQNEWDLWLVSKEGVNRYSRPRTRGKTIVVEDQYSSRHHPGILNSQQSNVLSRKCVE
jgi:hypothetical protein